MKEFTNGALNCQRASIYPELQKLEQQGMIKSYWKVLDGERPRKYYSIQDKGLELLKANQSEWKKAQEIINSLSNPDK